jgi:uncharacterized protein (TIGR00255 family)
MSVQSITGYGHFEQIFESGRYTAEIRSVNNRFMEIQCHLPRIFNPLEQQIRKLLNEKLERGTVKLNVSFEAAHGAVCIDYDRELVKRYLEIFNEISLNIGGEKIKDVSLLSPFFRDVIVSKPVELTVQDLSTELFRVIEEAMNRLITERKREGRSLKGFLFKSFDSISQNITEIERLTPQRIEKYKEKIQTAISTLCNECVDEQRIALEVVLMIEKLDITEEITRLKTHISATKKLLESEDSIGKRLGFWMQEINREINTIGSKANDSAIADIVVSMKDTAEQIREQSQNLL